MWGRKPGDLTVPGVVVPDDLHEITTRKPEHFKPKFDIKGRIKKLREGNHETRVQLLKAIHERFWHAPPGDMINMLKQVSVP